MVYVYFWYIIQNVPDLYHNPINMLI